MLPSCAARRMVTHSGSPGLLAVCASRRHSPGDGNLELDQGPCRLARVGCRGERNQAPSLGMAKHLGDTSAAEARGRRGWSELGVFCLPGALVRKLSHPQAGCPRAPAVPVCQQEPPSPACSLQVPLVSTEEMQLSLELVKNQNRSRSQEPLTVLGRKLVPVVPQVLICHGPVGGPHAGRVRGRRGASSDEWHVLVAWVPTEEHSLVHVL